MHLLVAGLCGFLSVGAEPARGADNSEPGTETKPLKYGLDFDGQDDFVEIASFRYDGSYPITIEAIAMPHSDRKGTVFADYEHSGVGLHLRDGRFMFNVFDAGVPTVTGSSRYRVAGSNEKADFHTPVHLAGVFDGSQVRLYVDGKLQPRLDKLMGEELPSGQPFWFGANPGPGGQLQEPFHGRIDAVRLSKGVLYEKDFTSPKRFVKSDATLILLNAEEGEGNTLKDESGNGYNGTVHGATWVRLAE